MGAAVVSSFITKAFSLIENGLLFVAIYLAVELSKLHLLGVEGKRWYAVLLAAVLLPAIGFSNNRKKSEPPRARRKNGFYSNLYSRDLKTSIDETAKELAFYFARSGADQTRILITKICGECKNHKQFYGVLIELILFCFTEVTFHELIDLSIEQRKQLLDRFAAELYSNLSKGVGKKGGRDEAKFVMLALIRIQIYHESYQRGDHESAEYEFDCNMRDHFKGFNRQLILPAVTCAVTKIEEGLHGSIRRFS